MTDKDQINVQGVKQERNDILRDEESGDAWQQEPRLVPLWQQEEPACLSLRGERERENGKGDLKASGALATGKQRSSWVVWVCPGKDWRVGTDRCNPTAGELRGESCTNIISERR